MKARFFFILLTLGLLTSCAGYHFNTNANPLISYDVRSVAVPMFINRSVIPELAAPLTKEIILALNEYDGLRVYSGNNDKADAVLIGVIDSKDHYNEVVETTQTLFSDTTIQSSTGNRSPFYYPVQSSYKFTVRFILIKRPSPQELELLATDIGQFMKINPKVVLMNTINLSGTFNRVVGENTATNDVGSTNFSKNKGIFEKSILDTAQGAAKTFKQVVLNAF